MRVLIVDENPELAAIWSDHLMRLGLQTVHATTQDQAISILGLDEFAVVVLNLHLGDAGAMAVSDYCNYRWPRARVVFVTNSTFFSDGSIFSHSANACAFIPQSTQPTDLAAMVNYYADH